METLQTLALKQAFITERNKIDITENKIKSELNKYGISFSFYTARSRFSDYYKEDEESKILSYVFGHMELCYCGMVFEGEDRNHYRDYRFKNHFNSKHHEQFKTNYEFCSKCESYELKKQHPCFNPMCECGERYNILNC